MTSDLIPVSILTGFLGSGKTTILSRLIENPSFVDTAIIVNEFGEVGLDHVLLQTSEETIVDLSCGCICCTIRGDLIATLNDLIRKRQSGEVPPFRRVVIETTGLADPAPIVHTLMQEPSIFSNYCLARIIASIDGVSGYDTLDNYLESRKQLALADVVFLTKVDLIKDENLLKQLEVRIKKINPGATYVECIGGDVSPDFFFTDGMSATALGILEKKISDLEQEKPLDTALHRHPDILTYAIERRRPISRGALGVFMQMLADQKGSDILRLKGIVALTDDITRPAIIHGVQHVIYPVTRVDAWPKEISNSTLVMIVNGIEKNWVENLLKQVCDSSYASLCV